MATTLINGNPITLQLITQSDHSTLSDFLESLSDDSKRRFGPHGFDTLSITEFYAQHTIYGFVAKELTSNNIIAYTVVKRGFWPHDEFRYIGYGLTMSQQTDATLAPAVADGYHGSGIGYELLKFAIAHLRTEKIERIFLWGGVQADNQRAIRFYERNGFKTLGEFEYHGHNYDMVLNFMH